MNKGRYRLVFSDEKGSYVPVPEETKACGKGGGARALRRLVAAMAAALPGLSIANPTGHQVVQGQVGVQVQGRTLNITASDRSIINWKQFSIQPGETTRFIQPGSTATVLNRVVGQDPSKILGNLIANGRVLLVNPNGILFGAGAKVDTAGLVASTLNIRNEDFTAGRYRFDAEGAAGRLRNEGTLKTSGGPLILIATDVENTGLITTENGDIVLAAGRSVEIADPHQPTLRVKIEAGGDAINLGQLIARGGNVGMFGAALTQAGKISATGAERTADGRIVLRASKSVTLTAQSETTAGTADGAGGTVEITAPGVRVDAGARVDTSGTHGGRIEIAAEQKVVVEGSLVAQGRVVTSASPSSTEDIELPVTAAGPAAEPVRAAPADAGKGGDIVVTADTVVLDGNASLGASGDTGGGSVLVGGDWQGGNAEVRNARISWIGHGVSLLADALLDGDGGKVVVWADQATAFAGSIWARGGSQGGNGGQVEVSGKAALLYRGHTDTRASKGRNGELLLDPLAIVIQGGSGDGSTDGTQLFSGGGTPGAINSDALGPTVIFESEIEEQSKTTDIILRAQRSVTVGGNSFSYTASGNVTGETTGHLALAAGSSLLIETRNLGAGEGGASAGIDLVSGGAHGGALQITTRGDGNLSLQTGYSNGEKVGNQIANIVLPVLGTASGSILIRTSDGSSVQLQGATYTGGGGIQISAASVTGSVAFNAVAGTQITGDYVASGGTLAFQGGASAISGTLTLSANLAGDAALTLGGLDWRSGRMVAGSAVTLTGAGLVDNSSAYRYLARPLNVSGSLTLANPSGYLLDVESGGALHLNAGGRLETLTANGFLYLGSSSGGSALLSADAGAMIDVATGTSLYLRTDGYTGNLIAGAFSLFGGGALVLDSGRITTGGDTTISGSGLLRMSGSSAVGGAHQLAIASNFNWNGGTMDGTGTTVLSGNTLIDNTSAYKYLNRRLEVAGSMGFGNSSGYYLQVGDGGTLHLGATGRLTTNAANGLIYLGASGTGLARLTADPGAQIDVAEGTALTLRANGQAGNQISGTFALTGAGPLTFDSGVLNASADTRIEGAGRFRLANGAELGGAGALTIDSAFDWSGGTFSGSGVTIISGDAVIDNTSAYKYVNRRVEVPGTLTFGNSSGYYIQIGDGGTLHLSAGGTLATTTANGFIYIASGTAGTARFSADADSKIAVSGSTSLTLRSDGNSGNQIAGIFALTGAGATHIDSGTLTTAAATTFTGAGLLRVSGGATLNLNHATTFDSAFRFEGGTLGGTGNVAISGPFTWAGGIQSGTGTTVLSGHGVIDNTSAYKYINRRVELDGTLTFGNSSGYYVQIGNGGTLHLSVTGEMATTAVNGLIYLASGSGGSALISADDGASINTAGGSSLTIRSDGNAGNQISGHFGIIGGGTTVFDSGVVTTAGTTRFSGDGLLRIGSGANMSFNHATTISSALRFDGGTMGGSGAVTITGPFSWAGGTMGGTGTTVLAGAGDIDNTSAYKYLGRRLEVGGSLTFGNTSGYYLQVNDGGTLHLSASGRLVTSATNGLIYLAGGSGATASIDDLALFSAADGAKIDVADGITLTLRSDGSTRNQIAGVFTLSGSGSTHLDSGQISANSDTSFTGSGKLMMSGGATLAGSGLVTISSGFEWTGGVMSGTGTTRLVNAVNLTGSGPRVLNRTLEIAAGGSLDLGDNVTIQRSTSSGGTGGIVALGSLTKSSGSGTAYIQYLDLQGNVSSSSGVLSIYGNTTGTNLAGTSFSTSGSGLLRLDSGLFTLTDGQSAAVAAGTLELSGATLSTAGMSSIAGAGTFLMTSGTLNGAGTLTFNSGFNWTSGTMAGAGTTRLVNAVNLSGSNTRTLDRTLEIAAGGSLNIGDNVLIQRSTSNGGTGSIVALGTLTKSSGSGTAHVRYLDLRGNISSAAGVLSIYGNTSGSSIAGAAFSSTGSGSVRIDSGIVTLNAGESANIASGVLELSGGALNTTGDSTVGGAGTLRFTSGTLNGIGLLTLNAGLEWSAGTMAGAGTTRLNGNGSIVSGSTKILNRTLEIGGSTRISSSSGALQIQDGKSLSVLDTGTVEIVGDASITHTGSGRIDNSGLMRKTGTAALTLAMPLTNTGTLRIEEGVLTVNAFPVNSGVLDLRNGASLVTGNRDLTNAGEIGGRGTINVGTGTLTNAGTLNPGGSGAAGTLTVTGNFAQAPDGLIEADVLGTLSSEQDHLNVSGSVALAGNLVLSPANGLVFGAQDRYTMLSCSADGCLSGAFLSVDTGGLGVSATSFSNALSFATGTIASTWISGVSGFWDVAANWAGGFIPGADNDVVIDQAGDLTVTVRTTSPTRTFTVRSLFSNENIAVTGSTLTLIDDSVINGRLTVSGGVLSIGTQLDTGALTVSSGTVSGGRLIASGSSNLMTGGTLSDLRLMLGSRFNASGGTLSNVTLSKQGSSIGAGQVQIRDGGDMRIVGALTLDNAEVTLASDGNWTYLRGTSGPWSIGGNGSILFAGSHDAVRANNVLGYNTALTLGSGVTVSGPNGGYVYFGNGGINNGTVSANASGKEISLNSWSGTDVWTNAGSLLLAGGQLHSGDSFINAGTIRGSGSLNMGSTTLTNTGTIFADGGVLNVTGNLVLTSGSTLRFEIGGRVRGVEYGALDVSGNLTFGGTLLATHVNGFVPGSSEAFRLVRQGSRAGSSTFAAMDVPAGFGYGSYYGSGNYLLGIGGALTGINEWISNTSGNWETATNWSLGVAPNDAAQTVIADRVGVTPTITISRNDWTVGSLLSEENLTISGGTLTVNGLTRVGGSLNVSGGMFTAKGALDLNDVTLSGAGQFAAQGAGHVANYVQHSGTSTFSGAGLALDAMDIRGGTVNYNAALALPSSLLRISGHTANLNADQGQTLIQVSSSGVLNLNLTSLTSDIELTGGNLNVAGSAASSGSLKWTGGNIGGGGTLTLTGVLDIGGTSNSFGLLDTVLVHANVSGSSRIAKTGGYFYLTGANAMLRNASGASLTIDTSGGEFGTYYSSGTGGTLHNLGTLNKTGAGIFHVYNPTHLDQAGALHVQQGGISVEGGTHAFSGSTLLAAGSLLAMNGGSTVSIGSSARFTGDGLIRHENTSVTLASGSRIDADYAQSAGTLIVSDTATLNGDLLWTGGRINGGGVLTANGVFDLSGNTTVYLENGTQLIHTDTSGASRISNTSSSGFNIQNGALFRNAGVLTIDTPNAASIIYIDHDSGTAGRFENTGTLNKTGAGTVDFGNYGLLSLVQQGAMLVNEGLVTLGSTATLGGATQIGAEATLRVLSGTTTTSPGVVIGGAGTLEVTAGALTLGNGTEIASRYSMIGGTLTVAGGDSALISNAMNWTGGTVAGGGTLNVSGVLDIGGGSASFGLADTVLVHTNASGASRIAKTGGYFYLTGANAVLRNASGASLTVDTSAGNFGTYYSSAAGGTLHNLGTLNKTGSGTFSIHHPTRINQAGVLNVLGGAVSLEGTGNILSGAQNIAAGAMIDISSGTTDASAGATFDGAGVLSLRSGTLAFANGLNTGINLRQSGGTFTGTGDNTLSGRYEWTGGNITGSGVLTVSGVLQVNGGNSSFGLDGRSLLHANDTGASSLYKTGGYFYLSNGATFTNAAGAQLYFDTGSGTAYLYGSGTSGSLVNAGTLIKVGSGSLYGYNVVRLQNEGRFVVAQGSVATDGFTDNPGVLDLLPGTAFSTNSAPLTNTGTISGHGSLTIGGAGLRNQGTVSPGGAGAIGSLRLTGNYVQSPEGTLQIERGNAGTDALIVSATATLGGTLAVSELTGYVATGGESNVLTASAISGAFGTITLPTGYTSATVGNRHILSYAGAICGGVCWDGGAGTLLWTDAANWTGDLLPGTDALVFIDRGAGTSVQLTGNAYTIRGLQTGAGNTLTISGGSLTISEAATLAGDLVISGGTVNFNAATQIAKVLLSAGTFGGGGTVTFTGAGSSWTGGDMTGTGTSRLATGGTFGYGAGTRTSSRRFEIGQGATFTHASGALTFTGGAANAGVIDVVAGATARYGGTAGYLLDSTGQFDGGGRIEFINSAVVTSSSTAPLIADSTFTVRAQDSSRFTMTTPSSIANLEVAGNAVVVAQSGFASQSVMLTGGALTLNGTSQITHLNMDGGTLSGPGATLLTGSGQWTRGTFAGNLRVASGATLNIDSTGADDQRDLTYKKFGAGTLTNDGTMNWTAGHVEVVGSGSVVNNGRFDIGGDFNFGDRWVGTGTVTLVNSAGGLIVKSAGPGETAIGSLGIPSGTANYVNFTNNGDIDVQSGRLRFNIGYSGASGGGTVAHNGHIHIGDGAMLEVGGTLTYTGTADIGTGGTLRRIGGFTIGAGADLFGPGTVDVGAGNTLTNSGHIGGGNGAVHGTLTVIGNFVQTAGGTLETEIAGDAPGSFDRLAVTGSASLGGTLAVTESSGHARDTIEIDIITTGAGITGSFAAIDVPDAGYTVSQIGNVMRLDFGAIACGGVCWDGGAGTSLWTDAANWTGNTLPGLNDLVFIGLDRGSSVVLNSGTHSIASLNTTAGNQLTISGGSLTLTGMAGDTSGIGSTLAGDLILTGGTLRVNGPATLANLQQLGGFSQFDGVAALQRLRLSGGEAVILRSNGDVTVTGEFDWRDQSDLDGSGRFTTAGHTTATGSGGLGFGISVDWHNTGTVDIVSNGQLHFYSTSDGNGGALVNEAGGVINIEGGTGIAVGTHSGPPSRFVNAGTINKNGSGDRLFEGNYSFDNSGIVQVTGGRLDIRASNADGAADTGRYSAGSGATLAFGGGNRTLAAGSDVTGTGTVELAGAQMSVNGGFGIAATGHVRSTRGRTDFASPLDFSNALVVRGGILNFNGDTRLNRLDMGWSGGSVEHYAIIAGIGSLELTGRDSTVADGVIASGVVGGYDTSAGPLYVQAPTAQRDVTIRAGAVLTFGGDQYADLSGVALANHGTLTLAQRIHLNRDNTIDNTGTLNFGSVSTPLDHVADVAWSSPGTLTIRNDVAGTLRKLHSGIAELAADVSNAGALELVAGTLHISGNYTQQHSGALTTHLDNAGPGRLGTSGITTLDGVLQVIEASGYDRISMDTDIISAAGGVVGNLNTATVPADYVATVTANSLRLRFNLVTCGGICWDGGAGTALWTDPANWTGDALPGITDLVFINLAGGADVILNAVPAVTVSGLTIGNANSLTLTGGVLNAPTTIQSGGTLNLDGGTLNFGDALRNGGELNHAGGSLSGTLFANSGTLNILPGSTGNLTTGRLENTGNIIVDAGHTVEFGNGGGMVFANDGAVSVRSGTLSVLAHDTDASGPGADSGDYTVDGGATLRFRDAFRDFGPTSSITGDGDVEFTAYSGGVFNVGGAYNVGGETRISGNTLVNFNRSATFGDLSIAGNVGGAGTLNVTDDLSWTAGTLGSPGRLIVVRGETVLQGRDLKLDGAILNISGPGLLGNGTQLAMTGGAQLVIGDDATLGLGSGSRVSGSGSVVNRGTLQGTLDGGSSDIGVVLANYGAVSASSGSLGLTGGVANTGSGSFVIGKGATMELGGDLPPDIFDRIGGDGTLSFSASSMPVINQNFAVRGGAPVNFNLHRDAVLSAPPLHGSISGSGATWTYTAGAGYAGSDSTRFTLTLGSGSMLFNVLFAVTAAPQQQPVAEPSRILPDLFKETKPPKPPEAPTPRTPQIASIDDLSAIVTASGTEVEQPLRDFRASRLQCR